MIVVRILSAVAIFIGATCCFWISLLALLSLGTFKLVPNPWVGVGIGFVMLSIAWILYFRERQKCKKAGCLTPADNTTKLILGVSTLFLIIFSAYTAYPYFSKGKSLIAPCPDVVNGVCKLDKKIERKDL